MTAHELAKKLLKGPDVPVCMFDWSHGDKIPTLLESAERHKCPYSVWVEEMYNFRYRDDTSIIILDSGGHPWEEPEGGWQHLEEYDEDYSNPER